MFGNPFSRLSINKHYPLAKLRRSSLGERFEDTFKVFNGRIESYTVEKNHVGLLDYFLLLTLPLMWLSKDYPNSSLASCVQAVKAPFSLILTLFVSPFILIGHGISWIVNSIEDRKLMHLDVTADTEITEIIESSRKVSTMQLDPNIKKILTKGIKETKKTGQTEKFFNHPIDSLLHYNPLFVAKIDKEDGPYISVMQANGRDFSLDPTRKFSNVKILPTKQNSSILCWVLKSNRSGIISRSIPENFDALVKKVDETTKQKLG